MSGLTKVKSGLKRTSAVILAALIASTATSSLPIISTQANAASSGVLSDEARGVLYAKSRTDFRDESIYFLITTRFYDGDTSNNTRTSYDEKAQNAENDPSWRGDFKGLIDKLDYIKALGFTAIWITPVVENDSGYDYHGYHAYDFSAVDTRYESNGITYQDLINACHDKGMKVIQDIVLNHTCNWGERNLLQLTSDVYPERNQAVMSGSNDPENIYHHNGFCGGGDWDNYEAQRKTIADDCFDLETENPKVYNYLVDCYKKYIKMGVDGFRIDTVKHISRLTFNSVFVPAFKEAGGDDFYMFGEVCTKGHDVWYRDNPPISTCFYTWADDSSWTGRWSNDLATNESLVEEHYASHMNTGSQPTSTNAFLNGNDYHTPDYSQRSGMDVIDFQMHWSFNSAGEAFGTALGEDQYFNDSTWNVVYVDSHDYAPDQAQRLRYNGGTDAWAENLSLMFTFRGIPCIYYGSEIEFQAGKQIDVGPDAPLSETGRAYFGDHIEGTVQTSDFTVFGNVSGEVQETLNSTLSQHIMRLNRIRQSVPALRKGQYSTEGVSGGIAFKRRYTDSTTDSFACVAISSSATFSGIPNGKYVDAVTGDVQNVTGGTLTANVSGKGNMKVYVLDTSKTPAPGRVITNGDYLTDGGAAEKIGPVPIDIVDETGVTLDKKTLTILNKESASLTATVSPENATYKTVTWSSSDESVAKVVNGTVTGVSVGTATITATTRKGFTATCKVTVKKNDNIVDPTGITLDKASLSLEKGDTGILTATVTPSNATDKSVTWTSSNASVASVSNGTVTALSPGTTVITAETSNGLTATCKVTVKKQDIKIISSGIYFEKPSGWGSSVNAYIYDTASTSNMSWPGKAMTEVASGVYALEYTGSSSTLKVIFNDGSNQVPASQQPGFDYKNMGYYTSSGWDHEVVPNDEIDVTSVTLNKTSASVDAGSKVTLTATVAPSNATDKTITWSSSDTSVAKVSSSGVVTGVKKGTATITASSVNGITASAKITVVDDDDLVNNSTLSATSITVGNSVTAKAAATGGTGSYKYGFYYKKSTASSWTTVKDFSTTKSVSITPPSAGTYTACIKVKDTNGTIAKKYIDFKVTAKDLVVTAKLSSSSIVTGNSVTVSASATGGSGSYKFAFLYKKSTQSAWTTAKSYSTTKSVSIKPANTGTYEVCVKVKDTDGTEVKKYLTLNTSTPLTLTAKLNSTSIVSGNSVTASASATGGSGSYKYAFLYKKSTHSAWTTAKSYSTTKSVAIKPAGTGTYNVCIKVKDTNGTEVKKYIDFKSTSPLTLTTAKLSASTVNLGSSVTASAAASGGTGSYKYGFYYKNSTESSWKTIKDFSTTKSVSVKPTSAGTYSVCIKVKDTDGTISKKYVALTCAAPLTLTASLGAESVILGNSITAKASATGGAGSYEYAFYYKQASQTSWATAKAFSTTKSVDIKPAGTGTYNVCIKVKDKDGTIVKKYIDFESIDDGSLKNNSTLSASSVSANTAVTVKCAASGGYSSTYYYRVRYMLAGSSSYKTARDYSTTATASLKLSTKGTYTVAVDVQDLTGTVKTKYLTLTVK